jgi:hypothetical protein
LVSNYISKIGVEMRERDELKRNREGKKERVKKKESVTSITWIAFLAECIIFKSK